jgi:hypothetical protein
MKKILLSLMSLAVVGLTAKVQAQACAVKNVVVTINSTSLVPGGLAVDFDASFDLDANGGNKYIFIQTWLRTQYPNYWLCVNGTDTRNPKKAPLSPDLTNAFLKLAINNDVTSPTQPSYTTYGFDATTMSTAGGVTKVYNAVTILGVTYDRFTLTNVQVIVPGIVSLVDPIAVTTDVFSTNGQVTGPNSPIHCVNCGTEQFFNDPLAAGIVPCSSPRVVRFQLTSVQNNTQFYYRIYKDDGDGNFEAGGDDVDVTVGVNPTITTDGSGVVTIANYPIVQPAPGSLLGDYWVSIIKVGAVTGVAKLLKPIPAAECSPLPVDFKSFTAARNGSNVGLKWETMTEQNNSGFAVERNTNGSWLQVAFVASQAAGGNSSSLLTYQYNDLNATKGISQYRIRQVDLDGRSKYSEIRSIRGDGQLGKTIVYPNPSINGRVNVVFEEANVIRDISVSDMSGRTVKQLKGVTNNNITIENLAPGMYSLRIVIPATGEQVVEKIVVNKR